MAAEHSGEDGGEGPRELYRRNRHKHKLFLQRFEGHDVYTCKGCKEKGMNCGYECSTPSRHSGKVSIFHVQCTILEDEKQHPVQGGLTFRFRRKTLLHHRCTACDHELKGFVYETENRDMRLHPLCLMLPREFEYNGQSFSLRMSKGDPYKCCYCNNINKHGWKYMFGDVCMDIGCAKYYLQGLSANGLQSSAVHRLRDLLRDAAGYVMATAGVAGGVAGVANFFHGYFG